MRVPYNSSNQKIDSTELDYGNYNILVVDDEPDIALLIKKVLEKKGYNVTIFTRPLEALDNFKENNYDLVLLDISMPDMDGIELSKQIRIHDNEIIICFLTAFDNYKNELQDWFSNEDICYTTKPFSISVLRDLVTNKLLERDSLRKER